MLNGDVGVIDGELVSGTLTPTQKHSRAFTFRRPLLAWSRTTASSMVNVDAADTIDWVVHVAHDALSSGPAYTVTIKENLPSFLTLVKVSPAVVVSCSTGSPPVGTDSSDTATGALLMTIPVLPLGCQATFYYKATVGVTAVADVLSSPRVDYCI